MKTLLGIAAVATGLGCAVSGAAPTGGRSDEPLFRKGDRWAVIGDSITHGRRYHSWIYLFYATRHPDRPFRLYNCGISGDTAAGAVRRYAWDIAPHHPTIATIMMGMNDVGRGYYGRDKTDKKIEALRRQRIEQHVAAMTKLTELLVAAGCRVVFLTPSIYDQTGAQKTTNHFGVNDALGECGRRVAALAPRFHARVLDLHEPMTALNAALQKRDPGATLTGPDRVHPGAVGQFVMAYLFLRAAGEGGPVAVVRLNAAAGGNAVEKTTNCRVVLEVASPRRVAFEYRAAALPFPVPAAARPALAIVPFSAEMNRETLAITGLEKGGKYVVEIDGASVGAYTPEELAAGVDLAANVRTPMWKQAEQVRLLNEKRHLLGVRLRTLAAQRHWICGRQKDLNPDDFEAMKAALRKNLEAKKGTSNYRYFKGQAEAYIKWKPREKELTADMEAASERLWNIALPRPHRVLVRQESEADRAALRRVVLDDFDAYKGWRHTGWTNGKPAIESVGGRLVVTAPRQPGVRDMLGFSRHVNLDLPPGGGAMLHLRVRADKGSPLGIEAVLDGKLRRLVNYRPATGDWETLSCPLPGRRMTSLTLILAEPSAGAKWPSAEAKYEFDRLWVELQKP